MNATKKLGFTTRWRKSLKILQWFTSKSLGSFDTLQLVMIKNFSQYREPWKFETVPRGYWINLDNQKRFLDHVAGTQLLISLI